jgi:hypothetical protein
MTWLVQDLTSVVSLPSYDSTIDELVRTGKLHTFDEWGGKQRTVALLDYWTQVLLTPLHDTIFHFLAKLPQDGTFNQEEACARVAQFTANNEATVNSFDLTAATDRLPLRVQQEVLAFVTNAGFAAAWAKLLVDRDYFPVDSMHGIRYAVGQPMGAKSSWAMLALTHHVIVQQAARTSSTESYTDYALLGDDIVLTGDAVANNYQSIISTLGVSINRSKSILAFAGATPAAEFCKRVFIAGKEYTTFPIKLIAKTIMNGRLAPQLQNELAVRGLGSKTPYVLKWVCSLVDEESARFLSILNVLPSSLTAIREPVSPGGKLSDIKTWYGEAWDLTVRDIKSAYLFTTVTEQLKRLDTLLRQAQIIHGAIEMNAFGYTAINRDMIGWQFTEPDVDLKKLGATMPKMNVSHPIVKAAQDELDRISALIADLRSGEAKVSVAARTRLLDMFRTSLVDSWNDRDAAMGQADRSLLQRSLINLSDIVLDRLPDENGKGGHSLDFTVNLAYVNRLWTVTWKLGEKVLINAVRSRVLSTTVDANARMTLISDNTAVSSIFRKVRGVSTVQNPRARPSSPVGRPVDPAAEPISFNATLT